MGRCAFCFFEWKVASPRNNKNTSISRHSSWIHKITRFIDFIEPESCIQWEVPNSNYVLMLKKMVRNATHCCTSFTFILKFGVPPCGKLTICHEMFKKLPDNACIYSICILYTAKRLVNNQVHACIHKYGLIWL